MGKIKLSQKNIMLSAAVVVCLSAALLLWAPWRDDSDTNGSSVSPSFESVLPQDTTIKTLGGWQKLTPPDGTQVYVFTDSIDDVSISVSQQQLPDSFKNDSGTKVAELAKSYNATTTINAEGVKAYIGASAGGPQSVIFTKNELLILIKSRDVISNDSWTKYINSLK